MGLIAGSSLLASMALGSMAVGSGVAAYGAYQQGQAQAGAAHYNAGIQRQNAAISRENAVIAEQSGEAQASIQGQKTRATIGTTTASQAASGVDVSSGSYQDVQSSERELGELDAINIRSNAAREAFGYRAQSRSEEAQSTLSEYEGKNASTAGKIGAASTLLGGASSAATKWQDWKIAGGM